MCLNLKLDALNNVQASHVYYKSTDSNDSNYKCWIARGKQILGS